MPIAGPVAQPDEPVIVEIDGLLWKPCPGAEATAAEFEAARSLFIEVHREPDGTGGWRRSALRIWRRRWR
jgi:hypothetical protein